MLTKNSGSTVLCIQDCPYDMLSRSKLGVGLLSGKYSTEEIETREPAQDEQPDKKPKVCNGNLVFAYCMIQGELVNCLVLTCNLGQYVWFAFQAVLLL